MVNVVEDEEMSSQGSVNAPVAPQGTATQEQVSAQRPTEQVGIPVEWKPWKPVTTQVSGVAGPTRTHSQTVPVKSTQVVAAPTILVDAPSRAETKQAFDEVSSALQSVSSQHEAVRVEMQGLALGMERMRQERAGTMETTAQVQATLQRTLSASSLLETCVGQIEEQQRQARAAAEEAQRASERALAQAALLKEEQAKSAQQLSQVFAAQSESAQQNIQKATQVAVQTQQEVKDLTFRAQKAEYAAQIATTKMEQQLQEMTQQVEQQKLKAVQKAQFTKEKEEKLAQQLAEAQQTAQSSALLSQEYEKRFSALSAKMGQMETLLVMQRQKSSQLESQLSAAQDRIGGAERRAKLLESENTRIQGEIQYWNDLYSQETGTTPPPHVSSASVLISPPAEGSMISSPPAESNVTAAIPNVPLGSMMPQDQMVSSPSMSFPSWNSGFGQNEEVVSSSQSLGAPFGANTGMHLSSSFFFGSDVPQANRGFGSSLAIPQEPNERRVSFGSTFPR